MSRHHLVALALVLAMLGDHASAELRGSPDGAPVFTAAEMQVIKRNVALSSLVDTDPWMLRRFLDVMAATEAQGGPGSPAPGTPAVPGPRPPQAPPASQSQNPDLDRLERAAPEALHDLFQMIKQAGGNKPRGAAK